MKKEIITPILSIFDSDGKFDENGNGNLIDYLIENWVDGILALGSSGEFNKFSFDDLAEEQILKGHEIIDKFYKN